MNLLDSLKSIDPAQIALKLPKRNVTFGESAAAASALLGTFRGTCVVLHTSNLAEAVFLLAAADGSARAVVLTSPALDVRLLSELLSVIAPDAILTAADPAALAAVGLRQPSAARAASLAEALSGNARKAVQGPTAWVMTTSGTTGQPKLVSHRLESLTRTTRRNIAKGAGQTWGLLYDFTRFAGLQVVLQSFLSGATLAAPDLSQPLADQLAFLARAGCTHLSATPTLWRKILMTPAGRDLPLRQITLGGEIADDAVLETLSRAFPDARISHIFASTEAGVGFSVSDRQAGFPTKFLTEPPAGIALRISDGRLQVRNQIVGDTYLGGGQLAEDGWVDTGDSVEIRRDRVFFLGRANGVINVAGNKVHPEAVERALLTHPQVAMARVYSKPNPITGALVAAEVVPKEGAPVPEKLRQELLAFLKDRLERHMVPAILRVTDAFEMTPAGKIKRDG